MVWSVEPFQQNDGEGSGKTTKEAWLRVGKKAAMKNGVLRRRKGLEFDGRNDDSTATDSDTDSEPDYKLSIPGARTMFDSKRNPIRRTIWILIALTCFFITVVQVQERIGYYISTPTRITVKIELAEKLNFPVVTICPRIPFKYFYFSSGRVEFEKGLHSMSFLSQTRMEELRPLAAIALNKSVDSVTLPYDLVSLMNLTDLWMDISQSTRAMYTECFFGRNKSCDDNGKWEPVFTIKGPCYSFLADYPVSETGSFNGLYMVLNSNGFLRKTPATPKPVFSNTSTQSDSIFSTTPKPIESNSEPVSLGWVMYLHDTRDSPIVEINYGDNINPPWNLDTQIILKNFDGVNLRRKPCIEDPTYSVTRCQDICLSRALIQRSQCRLPFMNQTEVLDLADLCNTSESYMRAATALTKMIDESEWNYGMCDCQRQCRSTVYQANLEAVRGKNAVSRLRVFFQDKNTEEIGEELDYDLIGLFCQIGGSVGLLIGASALTIVELLELGGHAIHVLIKRSAYKKQLKKNAVKKFRDKNQRKFKGFNPFLVRP